MSNFDEYRSPYSWRYGSPELRSIWSERRKRALWRQLWLALAEIQLEYRLVLPEQVEDLRAHVTHIDVPRALDFERELQHDVMAEVHTFAEQCPVGGGIIHLGMTSMDVVDNADALRVKASIQLILAKLEALLLVLSNKVLETAHVPVMGFTHLQPAEPTTLGYRFAQYLQDLLECWQQLRESYRKYRGKGLKGAVGTRASYQDLFSDVDLDKVELSFSQKIQLEFFPVTSQTYPRLQDYQVLNNLSAVAAVLHKFAFDLRILQMPALGEWYEPRREKQVGSSAMPFKHNPIRAEKINSLARLVAQLPRVAWDAAANSLLERTLDDSANRRTILPEAFMIIDEILITIQTIFNGMTIDTRAIKRNLDIYAVFSAQEQLLMELGRAGADRQEMHERLRQHANFAWEVVRGGEANPLVELVQSDSHIQQYLSSEAIKRTMQTGQEHLGDAAELATRFAASALEVLRASDPSGEPALPE